MNNQNSLTQQELQRYSRHLNLPEVGVRGQEKLKSSRVLVVGAGGLGCPAILYLAAAGVGKLGILDYDVVDVTNLQRQVIYNNDDVGSRKAELASRKARAMNPHIQVHTYLEELSANNIESIFAEYDVIIDATDNFSTRYLINDACVMQRKTLIYGAIHRFEGQISVFIPGKTPCYRCIFPEQPVDSMVPNCAEAGVLGVLPGIVGSIQASECIKILLSIGAPLTEKLMLFDALEMTLRPVKIKRRSQCPVCGDAPTITSMESTANDAEVCAAIPSISAKDLASEIARKARLTLLDVREQEEFDHSHLADSIHIPLGELPRRLNQLALDDEIVTYCRSGARSARAAELLRQAGASKVRNLNGGIRAWAHEVDPSMEYLV